MRPRYYLIFQRLIIEDINRGVRYIILIRFISLISLIGVIGPIGLIRLIRLIGLIGLIRIIGVIHRLSFYNTIHVI